MRKLHAEQANNQDPFGKDLICFAGRKNRQGPSNGLGEKSRNRTWQSDGFRLIQPIR